MKKLTERLTRRSDLGLQARKSYYRDPSLKALLDLVPAGSPGFIPAIHEVHNLQSLGIELTPAVMAAIGERFADYEKTHVPIAIPADATGEVVYYARIGNRVKIGTSANVAKRMLVIRPEELMAVEAGGVAVERSRHGQFRDLNTHGEWFRLEGLLVQHIEEIQEASRRR